MLTSPLALFVGLAVVPALLAVYLLRNRKKHRKVSSLILWVERTRMTQGGSRVQRNRLPLLFFLELLILLLLIWAAAGPRTLSKKKSCPLTIILDNSASMGAVGSDGLNTAQRLLKQLPKQVNQKRFFPIRVILAGTNPRWLSDDAVKKLLKGDPVAEWTLQEPMFNVDAALLFARTATLLDTKLLVLSDAPPAVLPEGGILRWLFAGQPLPNAGFVQAVRSGDRCMIELVGSGTVPLKLSLGSENKTVLVKLQAGEPHRMTFRLPHPSDRFEAQLPDDALEIDNHIILLPSPALRVRVRQNIHNPILKEIVNRALISTEMLDRSEGPCELFITDSPKIVSTTQAWIVRVYSVTNATPFSGPFVMNYESPLLDGISFEGLIWGGSSSTALPGMPVVMAGNVPLLTQMDDALGRTRFFMQIDPERSTLQYSPVWPILFWNLLQARAVLHPGFKEVNLRPGMNVKIPAKPGIIEKKVDGKIYRAAYNFLAPNESTLLNCDSGKSGRWVTPETVDQYYVDLVPLVILMSLILLALHQLLLRREQNMMRINHEL